ncbi:MAG TPA: hypothetical protein H9850_01605 [Candidatus Anaerobiospirillum pullistercoris]|uniref:Uncharacterized protein n=1 Tax=Candidatus Anaerobiospirillum pullistercoris TaxID=2838452 RepID=A0A9D1WBJ9_9GAMM|nr:hypothetical protein [Candidatus Anaerobiospirillum pullistercoris]
MTVSFSFTGYKGQEEEEEEGATGFAAQETTVEPYWNEDWRKGCLV